MKTKTLYISTTEKPITREKIWKLMADEFSNTKRWNDETWFLVQTENRLLRTGRRPDPQEIVIEVFLEQSQRDPANWSVVLRDPLRDTVLEIRKSSNFQIASLSALSLIAAFYGQLEQFSLQEDGFCFGHCVLLDLSGCEFLKQFNPEEEKNAKKKEADLTAQRDWIMSSVLMPLYRREWQKAAQNTQHNPQEQAAAVSQALFLREDVQEAIKALRNLDLQLISVNQQRRGYEITAEMKLRAWNCLYQNWMEDVQKADEAAEMSFLYLFDPDFEKLMVFADLQELEPEQENEGRRLKKMLADLQIYRLNGKFNEIFVILMEFLKVIAEEQCFPLQLHNPEVMRKFLKIVLELTAESLEAGIEKIRQPDGLRLLRTFLTDLPEDEYLRSLQVLTGLAAAAALVRFDDGPGFPDQELNPLSENIDLVRTAFETDLPTAMKQPAVYLLALWTSEFFSIQNRKLASVNRETAFRFFRTLQTPEKLAKPLTAPDQVAVAAYCLLLNECRLDHHQAFAFLYPDSKTDSLNRNLEQNDRELCRCILAWMEKYASIHGLDGLQDVYPIYWSVLYGETPDREAQVRFQNLFTAWTGKNTQAARKKMSFIRLAAAVRPAGSLDSSDGTDYLFQASLEMLLADFPDASSPRYTEDSLRAVIFARHLLEKGVFSVPCRIYEKALVSLNSAWSALKEKEWQPVIPGVPGAGAETDGSSAFQEYCDVRLDILRAAVLAIRNLVSEDSEYRIDMMVLAGELLDWFLQEGMIERLNDADAESVAVISYLLGKETSLLGWCLQAEKYLRFAESVLLAKSSRGLELTEMQRKFLIQTEIWRSMNAEKTDSPEMRTRAASTALSLIDAERNESRKLDMISFVQSLGAAQALAEGQPDEKNLQRAVRELMELDRRTSGQRDFRIHKILMEGFQSLIEVALSIGQYHLAGLLAAGMLDHADLSGLHAEISFADYASKSLLISMIHSDEKETAVRFARDLVQPRSAAGKGASSFERLDAYAALLYLKDIKKLAMTDYKAVLETNLTKVPVIRLAEAGVCSLIHNPSFCFSQADPGWGRLSRSLMNRENIPADPDIPRDFWQRDFTGICAVLDSINGISSIAGFQDLLFPIRRGKLLTEKLGKETESDLRLLETWFEILGRISSGIPQWEEPAFFMTLHQAEITLMDSAPDSGTDILHLHFLLNSLRAMAALPQENLHELDQACLSGEKYRNILHARGDDSADELLMIMLLMDAELNLLRENKKNAAWTLQKALSLYSTMTRIRTPENILVMDCLLEWIIRRSYRTIYVLATMRPVLKQAEPVRDSLRKTMLSGSKRIVR